MDLRSPLLWALRLAWAALPVTVGPALAAALDPADIPVRTTASAMAWAGWALVLLAVLVPTTVSLTVLRLGAPAAPIVTVWSVLTSRPSGVETAVAAAAAVIATALAYAPETGIRFVNGSAYPNERRFPLRVPAPLLAGPLPLSWTGVVVLPAAGAVLVAAGNWIAGLVVLGIGLPLAVVLGRALHGLSRRWLVFVPAGVVIHDPMTLSDPVLFPRQLVAGIGPAPADIAATDVTARALGLALQLTLTEATQIVLSHPGNRRGDTIDTDALVFTPTRPGAVLAEAESRRLAVR